MQEASPEGYEALSLLYDNYMGTGEMLPLWKVITDYYGERRVYAPRFELWYSLCFERTKERYRELTRIDPSKSKFDWLVTEYRERQLQNADTGTVTDDITGTTKTSGSSTSHSTDTGSETTSGTSTTGHTGTQDNEMMTAKITVSQNSGEIAVQTSDTSTESQDANSDTVELTKVGPMSIQYSAGIAPKQSTGSTPSAQWSTGASNPGLDWTNPSTQGENMMKSGARKENSGSSTTTTRPSDSTTTTEQPGGQTRRTDNLEDRTDSTGTATSTGSSDSRTDTTGLSQDSTTKTRTDDTLHQEQEIWTGRGGSPQELLRKAQAYIKGSSAWLWLRGELDTIFIGVYDLDDYPLYERSE